MGSAAAHAGLLWSLSVALHAGISAEWRPPVPQQKGQPDGIAPIRVLLVGPTRNAEMPHVLTYESQLPRNTARARRRVRPAIESTATEFGNEAPLGGDHATAVISIGTDPLDGPAGSAGPSAAAVSPAGGQGIVGQVGSASTGVLDELHRRLASSARRCYPVAARRLRLRGEVGLHFCLTGDGREAGTALRGTTGFPLLDRAARECVLAGALPAPGISGCYDVAIKFDEGQ